LRDMAVPQPLKKPFPGHPVKVGRGRANILTSTARNNLAAKV
jgi:hypothetical protein